MEKVGQNRKNGSQGSHVGKAATDLRSAGTTAGEVEHLPAMSGGLGNRAMGAQIARQRDGQAAGGLPPSLLSVPGNPGLRLNRKIDTRDSWERDSLRRGRTGEGAGKELPYPNEQSVGDVETEVQTSSQLERDTDRLTDAIASGEVDASYHENNIRANIELQKYNSSRKNWDRQAASCHDMARGLGQEFDEICGIYEAATGTSPKRDKSGTSFFASDIAKGLGGEESIKKDMEKFQEDPEIVQLAEVLNIKKATLTDKSDAVSKKHGAASRALAAVQSAVLVYQGEVAKNAAKCERESIAAAKAKSAEMDRHTSAVFGALKEAAAEAYKTRSLEAGLMAGAKKIGEHVKSVAIDAAVGQLKGALGLIPMDLKKKADEKEKAGATISLAGFQAAIGDAIGRTVTECEAFSMSINDLNTASREVGVAYSALGGKLDELSSRGSKDPKGRTKDKNSDKYRKLFRLIGRLETFTSRADSVVKTCKQLESELPGDFRQTYYKVVEVEGNVWNLWAKKKKAEPVTIEVKGRNNKLAEETRSRVEIWQRDAQGLAKGIGDITGL